jgi:hypothetical protein
LKLVIGLIAYSNCKPAYKKATGCGDKVNKLAVNTSAANVGQLQKGKILSPI